MKNAKGNTNQKAVSGLLIMFTFSNCQSRSQCCSSLLNEEKHRAVVQISFSLRAQGKQCRYQRPSLGDRAAQVRATGSCSQGHLKSFMLVVTKEKFQPYNIKWPNSSPQLEQHKEK